jgi:hypothetical protein
MTHHLCRLDKLPKHGPTAPIVRLLHHTLHETLHGCGALVDPHIQETSEIDEVWLGLVRKLHDERVYCRVERQSFFLGVEEVWERLLGFPIRRLHRKPYRQPTSRETMGQKELTMYAE